MHDPVHQTPESQNHEPEKESGGSSLSPPQFSLSAGGSPPPMDAKSKNKAPAQFQVDPNASFQGQPGQNIDNLAQRIYEAIDGLGTDEEQVYLALNQVRGNQTAIDALKSRYQALYGNSLEADIRGDFSGTELAHALSLLNSGQTASASPNNGAATVAPNRYQAAADAIHHAVDGAGTDEEAIYGALEPFARNVGELSQVMAAYQSRYNENMRERIQSEMSGSELAYAMHLLGGPAMAANVEMTEMDPQEANQIFAQLANLSFWTDQDEAAPVPYHFPPDGCYARAHLMAQHLTALGYASEKVFAVSTQAGGLNVPTDYAPDATPGSAPAVNWWYHVAPIVRVRRPNGTIERMVMDPSMASGPITIAAWTGMMRPDAFDEKSVAEMQALFAANNGRAPAGQNLVYTTHRDVMWPTEPSEDPDPQGAADNMDAVRGRLSDYADLARAHEMAAAIRTELRNPSVNVSQILSIFTHASTEDRRLFAQGDGVYSRGFPNLVRQIQSRVSPADFSRIQSAMAP